MLDRLLNPRLPADRRRAFLIGVLLVCAGVAGRWFVAWEGAGASLCVAMAVLGITLLVRCGRPRPFLDPYAVAAAGRTEPGRPAGEAPRTPAPAEPSPIASGIEAALVGLLGTVALVVLGVIWFVAYALYHLKGEAF